jgi:hypothetical protein
MNAKIIDSDGDNPGWGSRSLTCVDRDDFDREGDVRLCVRQQLEQTVTQPSLLIVFNVLRLSIHLE